MDKIKEGIKLGIGISIAFAFDESTLCCWWSHSRSLNWTGLWWR